MKNRIINLGMLIEKVDKRNKNLLFDKSSVRGVNNLKKFIQTKANLEGRDLSKFKLIDSECFVFNHRTSRNGSKFSIAYNSSKETYICTEDYVVFKIRDAMKSIILGKWLYLYFNRSEFDRYVITNSWGSSTEFYNWEDICNIMIEIPSITTQEKYVSIYEDMENNLNSYISQLSDLKLICDGYIEDLKRKYPPKEIGPYIYNYSEKNTNNKIEEVVGLSTLKVFREAQSRVDRKNLKNYKIVHDGDFAYVPTTDTWKVLAFAVNHFQKDVVVSPIYEVFSVDNSIILPDFLAMWMKRNEFDRYARFNSWGSARENFTFDDMKRVAIPIPDISIQKSIVDIYNAYDSRIVIVDEMSKILNDICPILIRGSVLEAGGQ